MFTARVFYYWRSSSTVQYIALLSCQFRYEVGNICGLLQFLDFRWKVRLTDGWCWASDSTVVDNLSISLKTEVRSFCYVDLTEHWRVQTIAQLEFQSSVARWRRPCHCSWIFHVSYAFYAFFVLYVFPQFPTSSHKVPMKFHKFPNVPTSSHGVSISSHDTSKLVSK